MIRPFSNVKSQSEDLKTINSGVCYYERCYNERMLKRTVINKIMMLRRTQMLQRTWSNTIGRRSSRMRMMCRACPLWL